MKKAISIQGKAFFYRSQRIFFDRILLRQAILRDSDREELFKQEQRISKI
jgi:hypothetical protein